MNPSKPTDTSQPRLTKDHGKTTSIVPSKLTATRESLQRSPVNSVSLARILHKFARNVANETNSTLVSAATAEGGGLIPQYTSASTAPLCQANNTSVSGETTGALQSRLCEQFPVGRTVTPPVTSENHKGSRSSHTQAVLHTSTARPISRSSCLDLVPESNGVSCGVINTALQKLVYCTSSGSQNETTTDPDFFKGPEVGLRGRQLFCEPEGVAKSTCLSASEGVAKSTCLSASEGGAKSTCLSASEGGAKSTCLSAQGVSSDKESRVREDRISRLKEFVQKKEREVERIRQQLHSLEEHKANLACETAILESDCAKKQSSLHSHGSGPVSRVSKIRSKVSAKRIRLHRANNKYVQVNPFNAFLPNFKEKGFVELLGLEMVVESILQRTEQMPLIN